jgi:hypothetical protein
MIDDRQLSDTLGNIAEASPSQLAEIVEHALIWYGHHGREVSEALLRRLKSHPSEVEEGFAQLESVEGVLSGRTDSL